MGAGGDLNDPDYRTCVDLCVQIAICNVIMGH